VSAAIRPVTQVALVEVKRASRGDVQEPVLDETGRQSKNIPVRITRIKLRAMILVGLILFIH
jgi:hypothetical protein